MLLARDRSPPEALGGAGIDPAGRSEITAWARRPSAVAADGQDDRLRRVTGEARDAGSIGRAVAGQDAVLVAFGPRSLRKDDVQEALMGNLIAAMKRRGVRQMVNLSAWGLNNARAVRSSRLFEYVIRPLFLRHVWADKRRAETLRRDLAGGQRPRFRKRPAGPAARRAGLGRRARLPRRPRPPAVHDARGPG
jgi:hypothetical protein